MQKDILDFLSEFAVFLQDHKFAVSESALAHLLRLVESAGVDITEEDEMLAALSVCLAKTGEQVAKMKALFREFLIQKNIPQREEQKEKEKQEKRKELDLFVSDAQKQLENLKRQKERIRKNIIQKAHENESKPKVSRKTQTQLKKLSETKTKSQKQIEQAKKMLLGELPWDEKQAGCLYQTLMKQAEKSLYDGDLEQVDAMMDISKELSSAITKRQKNTAELESAISQAQEETDQQIKKLQRQMKDEQRRYEDTCRELDRAFEQMKRGMDSSNDSLTIKPSSVIHRADFIGGGSIQTMNAEFVRLSEKPFKKLTEAEKNQMREYLRQNLLAFKTRMTRNINSKRRLSLNLEETMRESIRTCGQPINLIYKQPRRSKADLVLILDVSGSCKDASEMMLTFIGLLKEVFPRGCSAFAFVNSLYDISRVYDTEDVDNAAKQILTMIPRSGQYSNYERPLRSMWKEYRNRISKDSMIIFIGDARNNKNDAGENYIKNICRKAKCAYWLNTDDRKKWDQGDSIASVYGHYAAMYEIRNIRQLLGFLSEMK